MELELRDPQEARGRNGWFKPVRATLWYGRGSAVFWLEFSSKRSGRTPPIEIALSRRDLLALGRLLVKMAKGKPDVVKS